MVYTRKFSEFPSGTLTENVGLAGDVNTRGPASGSGGGGVTEVITQDTSALAVGRWVRFDTATNLYVHGLADTSENAEIVGVVLNILNPNQFTLQQAGPIASGTPGFGGFTPGIYFLSDTLLGEQTLTPPTTNGHIRKPLFDATSADSGWVICLEIGAVIGTPGPIPASSGGTDSNIHTINQPGNTFGISDWVRVSGDTVYSLADGTSLANSQAVGVVIANGDPNFTVQFAGWNSNTVTSAVDALGNVIPITASTVYYLSDFPGREGKICPTPPALVTHSSRPVFISESAISGTGYVLPQRPLLGENTDNNPNVIPVHQVAHGFGNGDVARISAINTYAKAQANSAVNALPVGFVEYVDADNFILHTSGYSDLFVPPFTPLTAGLRYFLSPTILGGITLTEPTAAGQYSVPMLLALNATTGYILEQRPLSALLTTSPIPVAGGGTGDVSFTPNSVIGAGATATDPLISIVPGPAGEVLTSNGPLLPATFQPVPGGGGGGLVYLATRTAANTIITFDNLLSATYDDYLIVFEGVKSGGGTLMGAQVGTGAGPTYQTTNYYDVVHNIATSAMNIGEVNNGSATRTISGNLYIYGVNSAIAKNFICSSISYGTHIGNNNEVGQWDGVAVVTSVKIFGMDGLYTPFPIATGTFRLYGISKA